MNYGFLTNVFISKGIYFIFFDFSIHLLRISFLKYYYIDYIRYYVYIYI